MAKIEVPKCYGAHRSRSSLETRSAKQSALARWRGIVRIAQRQLRHRFLENLLILLGIALGVGVLTGMGSFLRFLVSLDEDLLRSQPEMQSVIVAA